MATCPVRFEFQCEKAPDKLKFVHNVPKSLVTSQAAQGSPDYVQNFIAAVQPILKEHYATCRNASSSQCNNCDSPATQVLQTPMSWLHLVGDPFINVWVNAVCGQDKCETRIRQEIQDMMQMISSGYDASERKNMTEILPCKICGKTEQTLRCAKCKNVAYCGKEHQKEDWKLHKRFCTPKA